MEKLSFDILLNLKNNLSASLVTIKKQFDTIEHSAGQAGNVASRFGNICSQLRMPDLNAFLGVAERMGGLLNELSQDGMKFGQSMADLSAITGITGDALDLLRENARQVGQESGLGADTAARAYAILASQIDVATIGMEGLNILQQKSVTLAQASGMSIDAAATSLAGTINQFGLSAEDAERVVNVLAAGSKYGAAEIEELSQSFKVSGAAAAAMGLTVEQSAGALEVLSKANLKGSEAGTALRNIILKLNTELGVDLSQTSLSTALEALQPRLTDATYLSKLFGMENIAAAQYLIQNAAAIDEMTQKVTDTNVAQEQAAIRTQTTTHKMEVLRAKVNDIKIGLTDMMGPFSAYTAVIGENAVAMASIYQLGGGVISMLNKYQLTTKVAIVAQASFNGVLNLGKNVLYVYQMQVLTASAAITSTTGAVKLMNIAIAASPYMLAATAVVALGVGIYKLAQRNNEAAKAQERMNDAMAGMQKEITAERMKLDVLFDPLMRLKEGTDEWKRARDRIQETYGDYLSQLGIEEISTGNVRKAYDLLAGSILNVARARASEKALTASGEELAEKEAKSLAKLHELLTEKYGETTGQTIFNGIAASIRKGEQEIPKRWQGFIAKMSTTIYASNGTAGVSTTMVSNQVASIIKTMQSRRSDYEKEYKQIVNVLGKPIPAPMEAEGKKAPAILPAAPILDPTPVKLPKIKAQMGEIDIPKMDTKTTGKITDQIKNELTGKDAKLLLTFDIPKLSPQKSGFEAWNETIEATRLKNQDMIESMNGIGSAMGSMGKAVGGAAGQWLNWAGSAVQAIATVIPQMTTLMGVQRQKVSGNIAEAGSGAAAATASIPIIGPILAVSAVASVLAALANLPKFANGGLAYGPTLGLFGEYSGAKNNPEVIAPLDKLRQLIQPADGGYGKLEFKLRGRVLKAAIDKETRIQQRTK